jgi:hypothetical protein
VLEPLELEPEGPVVPEPGLDGDVAELAPDDGDVDVEPLEPVLPVRSDVEGDADGDVVLRSPLPDGPWLQPVASTAMSENAKTPLSNFFMAPSSWLPDMLWCSKRGAAEGPGRALDTTGALFYYLSQRSCPRPTGAVSPHRRRSHRLPRMKENRE